MTLQTGGQYKPTIFVGSSAESVHFAQAIQSELRHGFTVVPWTQWNFTPSIATLEVLLEAAGKFDYGLFVLAPDDVAVIRNTEQHIARDNVLFELGMFFGAAGRSRSFFIVPRGGDLRIPSDLNGVTALDYDPADLQQGVQVALGHACNLIRNEVTRQRERWPIHKGAWRQTWTVPKDGVETPTTTDAGIVFLGDHVRGWFEWEGRPFIMEGQVHDRIVTGRWGDAAGHPFYYGTFQLYIATSGRELHGRWLGWSQAGIVKSGDWKWEAVATEESATATAKEAGSTAAGTAVSP